MNAIYYEPFFVIYENELCEPYHIMNHMMQWMYEYSQNHIVMLY